MVELKPAALMEHARMGSGGAGDDGRMKAKLGMLIVHGPGLDMLDLLVAANLVAIFRRWEGWGKEGRAVGL